MPVQQWGCFPGNDKAELVCAVGAASALTDSGVGSLDKMPNINYPFHMPYLLQEKEVVKREKEANKEAAAAAKQVIEAARRNAVLDKLDTQVSVHVCTHVRVCACAYVCVYVHCICACVYVCVCERAC